MTTYFIPYSNNQPASIEVKGHRLLLVATNPEDIEENLDEIGGDRVEQLEIAGNHLEQSVALSSLAESIKGGVVLAPPGVSLSNMLDNLEKELPWMQ